MMKEDEEDHETRIIGDSIVRDSLQSFVGGIDVVYAQRTFG